jgi:dGTP triphosphohydrolase
MLKAIHYVCTIEEVRMKRFAAKVHHMIEALFEKLFCTDQNGREAANLLFQRRWRLKLEGLGNKDHRNRARLVCDFLWGLTELELINLYQTIFESMGGSPFLAI